MNWVDFFFFFWWLLAVRGLRNPAPYYAGPLLLAQFFMFLFCDLKWVRVVYIFKSSKWNECMSDLSEFFRFMTRFDSYVFIIDCQISKLSVFGIYFVVLNACSIRKLWHAVFVFWWDIQRQPIKWSAALIGTRRRPIGCLRSALLGRSLTSPSENALQLYVSGMFQH